MRLRRRIDDAHSVIINRCYPKQQSGKSSLRHRVVIGAGGNIGDTERRMVRLWHYLKRSKLLQPVRSGVLLQNPPFGYVEQPPFLNTTIEVATSLSARAVLRVLWKIEHRFGRIRSFPNAPRTLDLDIIYFDNRVISYPELQVPHPGHRERVSVTVPLKSMSRVNKKFRRRYENLDI